MPQQLRIWPRAIEERTGGKYQVHCSVCHIGAGWMPTRSDALTQALDRGWEVIASKTQELVCVCPACRRKVSFKIEPPKEKQCPNS